MPGSPRETAAPTLDGTGYADALTVDSVVVPLSEVIAASVGHPERPTMPT